jgi:hypothetical protein
VENLPILNEIILICIAGIIIALSYVLKSGESGDDNEK